MKPTIYFTEKVLLKGEKLPSCWLCDESFPDGEKLNKHIKEEHPDNYAE